MSSVLCCPAKCTCQGLGTLWCIKRGLLAIPQHIPPDTSSIYAFENSISALRSEDFAGLGELKLLHLSHNKISRLPHQVFQPLVLLSNLDLSSNQITEIANETFAGLRELKRLYLQKNKITTIQAAAFQNLDSLVELKVQDNQLHCLPPLQLPTLLLLDLSRNNIPAAELGSMQVPELESLRLAGLGLQTINEEMFKGMLSLQELDLSDNGLTSLSALLPYLRGLTSLNLQGNNQISQLWKEDFKHLGTLQKLDISGLSLRTIPQGFLDLFPKLRSFTAAENPYNCVCHLGWFVQWVQANGILLQRQEETRCHFPPVNAGKPLAVLALGDMGCPTTSTTVSTATTACSSPTTVREPTPGNMVTEPPGQPSDFNGRVTPGAVIETKWVHSEREHPCLSVECFNGGICHLDRNGHQVCMCQAGFHGDLCEMVNDVLDLHSSHKSLVNVSQITSTSVTLDLEGFRLSPVYYKGLRLTYKNWSGADPRPVSLNIPTSLQTYSIRGLRPNSTYQICVGALGETKSREEPCAVAHTLPISQPAPFVHEGDTRLTSVLWPAIAGIFLVAVLVATIVYYCRRKHIKKKSASVEETHPYDTDGIKPCLQEGLVPSDEPKEAVCLAMQSELPLIQETQTNSPNAS
ncbi:vasorin-like isoform X2 [Narcine bancroftii]